MMNLSSYKYILSAAMLLLLGACAKEKDLPVPAPEVKTIHYSITVEEGSDTRSTLGPDYKHQFEAGDRIYVESTGEDAGKMYGFLSMSIPQGVGESRACFEGDLTSVANFTPTAETPISLTLVGPADNLHTIVDGKVTDVDYTDKYAVSLSEAVRKYAHFTGSGTFGDHIYTLQQNTSFLVCALSFDAVSTPAGTSITFKIYNGSSSDLIFTYTATATDVDGDIEVSWVIPFAAGVSFTNAKMTVSQEGKDDVDLKMADANFVENKFYTFQRTTYLQNYFTIEAIQDDTQVTFNYADDSDGFQYSRDGFEWFNYKASEGSISLSQAAGMFIYIRGKKDSYKNASSPNKPLITVGNNKPCYVYGDLMFLMCDAKFKPKTSMEDFAFQGAFKDCTWLRLKEDNKLILSATTLSKGCYADMFSGCTGLTSLAGLDLPGADVSLTPRCFDSMFYGCSNITAIPEGFLPWTQLAFACYRKMFDSCTSLDTVPSGLLPAKDLATACYLRMFFGCANLVEAPYLLATVPAPACYFAIFRNCAKIGNITCLMYLTPEQRAVYMNPDKNKYDDTADPPADNLEKWEMISAWSVFNKWLYNTSNQPQNNKSSSTFIKNPQMEYNRVAGTNWMGVIPNQWTVNDYTGEINW